MQLVAQFAYEGGEGELKFRAGDVVEVINQGELGGWWEGRLGQQTGYFPSNYFDGRL